MNVELAEQEECVPTPGTRVSVAPDIEFMARKGLLAVKIRAIAYVRVSKAREIMYSPKQQLIKIREYADGHGIEIVDVVEDLNKSGRATNYEKRKLLGIIKRISEGEANAVIVWKFSRFGRSKNKNLVYIALLSENGGRLISATEAGNEDSITGRFSREIIMAVDQLQAELIGENWKTTHARRLGEGLPHSGVPRFGYMRCVACKRNDQNTGFAYCNECKGIFTIDPVRGPVLKEMYERFIAGEGMAALTREMSARGVTSTGGSPISQTTWLATLDTGFAAGLLRSRSEDANPKSPNLFERWDVWVHGAHPALITMDQWAAYKKRRLKRQGQPARTRDPQYEFSGLIRCGGTLVDGSRCLHVLRAQPTKRNGKVWVYYRCANRDGLKICDGRGISQVIADRCVHEWIIRQTHDESTAEAAMLSAAKATQARETVDGTLAQVEKVKAKQARLAQGWVEGLIADEVYRNLKEELEDELALLATRQSIAEETLAAVVLGPDDYRPIAENWQHATGREKNLLLREVIDHVLAVNSAGRKYGSCRVIAKGERYDYEFPVVGRRPGVPILQAASR